MRWDTDTITAVTASMVFERRVLSANTFDQKLFLGFTLILAAVEGSPDQA